MNDKCPIWGSPARVEPFQGYQVIVNSERAGGLYIIPRNAQFFLEYKEGEYATAEKMNPESYRDGFIGKPRSIDRFRARLTTWLIEQRQNGNEHPMLTKEVIEHIERQPDMSISGRADKLLQYIDRETPHIGKAAHIPFSATPTGYNAQEIEALAQSESINTTEVSYLLDYLESQGWLKKEHPGGQADKFIISVKGYAHLDELKKVIVDSEQAFVAMWFDPSTKEVFDKGFEPGIDDAGYKAFRIDRKEFSNKIDDEIIAQIRRSRFLVADFTDEGERGGRGGVYYEAGFAHGLNIPVIFTCQKDKLKHVHFDTRQYNHIDWKDPEDLRKRLADRIAGDTNIPRKHRDREDAK